MRLKGANPTISSDELTRVQAKPAHEEGPAAPGRSPRTFLVHSWGRPWLHPETHMIASMPHLPSSLSASFTSSLDCGSFMKAAVLSLSQGSPQTMGKQPFTVQFIAVTKLQL